MTEGSNAESKEQQAAAHRSGQRDVSERFSAQCHYASSHQRQNSRQDEQQAFSRSKGCRACMREHQGSAVRIGIAQLRTNQPR
jgi:hypothetical protein